MKRNKYIIIGLGSIGQELLKKMSRDIDIVCIELNPELEEPAKKIRENCTFFAGDATSRLVLEEAGVADSDGVIITTTSEKVNIETSRILREDLDAKRVIAIGTTTSGIETLENLGVEVESIFIASAVAIRNRLAQATRAAHAIGLGKEEILEVEVHPHSRLAGRPLRTLSPLRSAPTLLLSAVLTLIVFVSNLFPILFSRFMRLKITEAAGMSLILSAPLAMMVVAGTLGVKMNLITDSLNDSLILTAVAASIIFPSLFRPVARRLAESGSGQDLPLTNKN